jgi:hypothetical protein
VWYFARSEFEGTAATVPAMYDGKYVLVPMEPRRENNLKNPAVQEPVELVVRRHPVWAQLEDAILYALQPFMEARAAVLRALDAIQPVSSA